MNSNQKFYSRNENSKDNWETPPYFFNLLNEEFHFTLDPCSSDENHLCDKYYTIETNGLIQDWEGETVFVNPPFKNNNIWSKKCYEESQKDSTIVVMILPTRSDAKYWHEYIMKSYEIRFCLSRVNFLINGKRPEYGVTFPLSIVVFKKHDNITPKISTFHHKGFK